MPIPRQREHTGRMRAPRVVPLLAALVIVVTTTASAPAVPPAERTLEDPVEPGKAFDIVSVRIAAAPAPGRKATIAVQHDRRVDVGDAIDVWVDTDADWVPDLFVTGASFSEYAVYRARSWTSHGREITDQGCASLKMDRRRSVVRVDPSCLAPSTRFSVSVRSYGLDEPARTDDYVPGKHRFSPRVLSYLPD